MGVSENRRLCRGSGARRQPPAVWRSGAATLELILGVPFLVIAVMALVEFGLLYSNTQLVEMASRSGAQVASRLASLSDADGGPAPVAVVEAVNAELAKLGITARQVTLEHNVDPAVLSNTPGDVVTLRSPGGMLCPDPLEPAPPGPTANGPARPYVRVTVCVATTDVTPNLLSVFCVDLSNRVTQQTTTRRYALSSP